ncbi:ATPase family AAA domain-containing protein 2-like isoform 1-T5 [Podargus strigoides]
MSSSVTELMQEAQRTAPSIIYSPDIHLWWEAVGDPLKAIFRRQLQNIPAFVPVLLLATSNACHTDLLEELPDKEERRAFFQDLILNQAAKPPVKTTVGNEERKCSLQLSSSVILDFLVLEFDSCNVLGFFFSLHAVLCITQ